MTRVKKKTDAVSSLKAEDIMGAEAPGIGEGSANAVAAFTAPEPGAVLAEIEVTGDASGVGAESASASVEGTDFVPAEETAAAVSSREIFIPLDKLKKSPRNARKTPHSGDTIEAYAASIAAKGILQNLVVEPEYSADGLPTGFFFVTIGEGRRLAQLLRAKRKEIKRTEPIRCVIDTANDAFEISLDENVNRAAMHPADQFEAFRELADNRGWGAEEIAARFGVTAQVVRQRLQLGAVSPKLMQIYRDGGLNLDQLKAFAITDDHARQEQVYENLGYNREPWIIRRDLTRTHVQANDRKAVFVGPAAYTEAGGAIVRDLFTDDRGGYYEDAALLDQLVVEKLERTAADIQATEGWKWVSVHIDYPHGSGFRRVYPHSVALSEENQAAHAAAQDEFDRLTAEWENAEEDLPPDVDERLAELGTEIERINTLRHAFDPDDLARGGTFVVLNHDGTARIERGFIRPEDEAPESDREEDTGAETVIDGVRVNEDGEIVEDDANPDPDSEDEEPEDDGRPISDSLVRDLTAHRTLGLRLALGEQPDMALIAVTHALAAQTFYRGKEAQVLDIRPYSLPLGTHADGIDDTAAAKMLSDRHGGWALDMPQDVGDLWSFITGLDQVSVMALFAHCASLTVSAVKLPWDQKPRALATADKLATALGLDMSQHWRPTVRTYLGRVTKAHILAAVQEALGDEAAGRLSGMKKQPMAEAVEQLLTGTGWLPPLMRTERSAQAEIQQTEAAENLAEETAATGMVEAATPGVGASAPAGNAGAVEDGSVLHDAAE